MGPLKARVKNGRLVLDDSGTELDRVHLLETIEESEEDIERGDCVDAIEFADRLLAEREAGPRWVESSVRDHAAFRRWATSGHVPDDVSVSYIGGEVLIGPHPAELEAHSKVKGELTSVLVQLVKDLGETYPDRALLTNEAAELSTEPDFVFVSWGAFDTGRVRLVPKANRPDDFIEIEGTPDLVIEVVSDSSKRKDTELLRAAYARAGVPEYWLVDARSASLSFVILHLSTAGTSYEQAAADGELQPSKVLERSFSLHRARNRIGRWSYTLNATRRP